MPGLTRRSSGCWPQERSPLKLKSDTGTWAILALLCVELGAFSAMQSWWAFSVIFAVEAVFYLVMAIYPDGPQEQRLLPEGAQCQT